MLYTIMSLEDVFRTDIYCGEVRQSAENTDFFSTDPADYISRDGIYF